jgi:hypothetical protein
MEDSAVRIDVVKQGPVAKHLAQRCADEGGRFVVAVKSAEALTKSIKRIGWKVFPNGPAITSYVLRHQRFSDSKLAFGAGEMVALAGGQCTDETQKRYGNVQHGRKGGLIGAYGSRKPRLVSVARAKALGDARNHPQPSGPTI